MTTIQDHIQARGYQAQTNAIGDLLPKLMTRFGGMAGTEGLLEPAILRLCQHAQIRKGYAYTLEELRGLAQPQDRTPQFRAYLQDWVAKGLFFRGYRLTCPHCTRTGWYAPPISEAMTCDGCRIPFQPSLELPFAFRPNYLLTAGLNNGALTILLFLYQLRAVSQQVDWLIGQDLHKAGQTVEIDLITRLDDIITVVECKDDFDDTEAVQAQLERSIAAARDLNAHAFLFATLKPDVPPSIQTLLHSDDGMLIRLMARADLLRPLP